MVDSRFAPHGQFRVFWCDDVLYSELHGTFNVQAMRQYIAQLKALGGERPTRWDRLAHMLHWEGMTPDASKLFDEFAVWIKSTECKVSVQLLPTTFQKTIAAHVAQRLRANHLYQVTSPQEALQVFADYNFPTQVLAPVLAGSPPRAAE